MHNVTGFKDLSSMEGGEYVRRYDLLGHRRGLLLRAIDGHRLKRYGITRNSSLVSCHVAPIGGGGMVEIKAGGGKARYSNVATCHNPLCPVCGRRIMAVRSDEVRAAMHGHMQAGGECYMVTLTIRHTRADGLAYMLGRLDRAWAAWRKDRAVRAALLDANEGYIRALEVQYGLDNGYHPHYHVLYMMPRGWVLTDEVLAALRSGWVAICKRAGLDASYTVGCNIERVERAGHYLTKIGAELALSQNKAGRGGSPADVQHGHYSHTELLELSRLGYAWAGEAALEELAVLRGKHLLHWSLGLKARWGIADKSDDEICEASDEGEALAALVQSRAWRCFPWAARGGLLASVAAGDGVAVPFEDGRGHRFYVRDYGGVPLVVVE